MLGLDRTASLDDIKRAYRRLAKANHPDAAGDAATPRFLAIQAAYERLVGPAPGRTRPATGSPAATPTPPWQADPARTDATHRAYSGRARRPAGASGARTGRSSRPGTSSGPSSSGSAGPSASEAAGGSGSYWQPRKATLGSTSYDGTDREAFEPDWVGASWYGTSSGTYWTTNPREYADPRKHGPEYQARARRASRPAQVTTDGAPAPAATAATGAPVAEEDLAAMEEEVVPGKPPGEPPGEPTADRLSIGRRIVRAILMARRSISGPTGPTGPVS
jgi:hypothetical protein